MSQLNPWEEGYQTPPSARELLESGAPIIPQAPRPNIPSAPLPPPFITKTENTGMNRLGMLAGPNEDVAKIVNKGANQNAARKAEGRSPAEKQLLWSAFASEYLRDYNCELAYIRACGRVGKKVGKNPYAKGYAMRKQPFVQALITKVVDALNEEELVTRKDVVLGLWKEANNHDEDANGGSRVRALMGLARIKQMDTKTVKKEVAVQNVMRVPVPPDNDAWAAAASESQRALKDDVRT